MTLEVGDKVTLEVGNKIDAWCGRCKSMLRHTIEVITGEKIGRVQSKSRPNRAFANVTSRWAQIVLADTIRSALV